MRTSTIVMIGFAVLFGLLAVFLAQSWLNSQAECAHAEPRSAEASPIATQTIVVAAKPLRFGNELARALAARNAVAGRRDRRPARSTRSPSCSRDGKRVVLTAIEPTSRCWRRRSPAPASARRSRRLLQHGMKAVTIRVNDVEGVAGFVLPGDRVDVALTRQIDKENAATPTSCCRTCACSRSTRSPTSAGQAVDRQGGHARSRYRRRRRSSRSPPRSARLSLMLRKAGEAASERSTPRHAQRSVQRRRSATSGHSASRPSPCRGGAPKKEGLQRADRGRPAAPRLSAAEAIADDSADGPKAGDIRGQCQDRVGRLSVRQR